MYHYIYNGTYIYNDIMISWYIYVFVHVYDVLSLMISMFSMVFHGLFIVFASFFI